MALDEFGSDVPAVVAKPSRRRGALDIFGNGDDTEVESADKVNGNPKQWTCIGSDKYVAVPPSTTKLPAGMYKLEADDGQFWSGSDRRYWYCYGWRRNNRQ